MKNIAFLFLLGITAVHAQTLVKFAAKIENRNTDSIAIYGPAKFLKVIHGKNGVYADSFEVKPGLYQMTDGVESTMLYLKNGYDLNLNMDAKMFDESIVYTGNGSNENNYLAKKALTDEVFEENFEKINNDNDFAVALKARNKVLAESLESKPVDAEFKTMAAKIMEMEEQQFSMMYKSAAMAAAMKGKPSPTFNYENHKGGMTKLEDLRGKYVYIDTWATWCGPCIREMPAMKEIEKKYHGKNITFLGISIDAKKDHDKWKAMVDKKELGGVQVFADNDWNSQFVKDYGITGIPRFILLDPKGNVVESNAPRPSEPALIKLLDELLAKK